MEDTKEDFSKKYDGTYFDYLGDIVYGIGFDGAGYRVRFVATNALKLFSFNTMEKTAKPWFPKTGMYNVGDKVWFIGRSGKRQWQRSFCSESSVFIHPFQTCLGPIKDAVTGKGYRANSAAETMKFWSVFNQKTGFDWEVKSVFEISQQKYPDLSTAMTLLDKRLAVAVSSELVLMHALDGEGIDLYYYHYPIGVVKRDTLKLNDQLFHQEVSDYLHRKNDKTYRVA